ncbi:prolipoprotein diacylglyceryl transferase [Anaerolentibacter hominis]|uniref:prolipoprotein diacylglyceryl transferase n=1 Tax=Anaerolentibacter hominis TaxID=3079009 RepID=UPI0031B89C74
MTDSSIRFPGLGITFSNLGDGFTVFGFKIAYYGVILTLGMVIGYLLVEWQSRRTGQGKDKYLDFAIYAIIFSVIGARIYYVIFAWDYFQNNLLDIFNIRTGGLAIYGGVIAGVLTAYIYCKKKKWSFPLLVDTCCVGLIAGQAFGRWGNFMNREAFGDYTNSFMRMLLPRADVAASDVTQKMLDHTVIVDGIEFISVHPTFLYEFLWNLMVLALLLIYTKYKKYDGEIFLMYLAGYGLGRAWIEGLRTDQLLFWGTTVPVSQIVSIVLFLAATGVLIYNRIKKKSNRQAPVQ